MEEQGAEAGGVRGGVLIVLMGPGEAGVDELRAEGDRAPLYEAPDRWFWDIKILSETH